VRRFLGVDEAECRDWSDDRRLPSLAGLEVKAESIATSRFRITRFWMTAVVSAAAGNWFSDDVGRLTNVGVPLWALSVLGDKTPPASDGSPRPTSTLRGQAGAGGLKGRNQMTLPVAD
jgi:hypothetical protein